MGNIRVRKETNTLFFDFRWFGERCREQTALTDTPNNRKELNKVMERINAEITLGTFDYGKYFPNSPRAQKFAFTSATDDQPDAVMSSHQIHAPYMHPDVDTPRLTQWFDQWVEENEASWKGTYQEKLTMIFNKYISPVLGKKKVSDITKTEVLQLRANLAKVRRGEKQKPLSAGRINQVMGLLRQLINEAADRFDFNTSYRGIKPLRMERTQVDPFSLDEVQLILDTVRYDFRNYLAVRFFTGLRTSEIDGLKWENVDFERNQIHVKSARVDGEETSTKTIGSVRFVEMSSIVKKALEEQLEKRIHDIDYVFCSPTGLPVNHRNFTNRVWHPLLKELGFRKRRPYQTRHTAATLWLAAGESPEWIARQLGHTTTKMLFTVYSRYVPNLTRQDGSAMDRLLSTQISL
jgi:integrase